MAVLKSRWKKKGTGDIIHPETEVDQIMNGSNALNAVISTLLKAASSSAARSAIEAAAASHSHASGDITSFATSVINAIGTETLSALGVRYSITTNGYICFGDLFGGLILQWNYIPSNSEYWNTTTILYKALCGVYFPIAFNKVLCVCAILQEESNVCATPGLYHYNNQQVIVSSFYLPGAGQSYRGYKTNFTICSIGV